MHTIGIIRAQPHLQCNSLWLCQSDAKAPWLSVVVVALNIDHGSAGGGDGGRGKCICTGLPFVEWKCLLGWNDSRPAMHFTRISSFLPPSASDAGVDLPYTMITRNRIYLVATSGGNLLRVVLVLYASREKFLEYSCTSNTTTFFFYSLK